MLDALREPISLRTPADRQASLRVTAFSIVEELGLPWSGSLDAVQAASAAALDPAALLGAEASLRLTRSASAARAWDGIITACERLPAGATWRRWRLTLAHPLLLADLSRSSRVVRDRDAASLAVDLLGSQRRPLERDLRQPPPKREQLTQWRESDLAWALRLLEHHGISLVCTGDRALLTDHPGGFPRLDLALPYLPVEDDRGAPIDPALRPALRAWRYRLAAVGASAAVRDWNWRAPHDAIARDEAVAGGAPGGQVRDDGSHHRDGAEAGRLANLRAEQLRCAREVWLGTADHPALAAGHVIRVAAPDEPEADGSWLLTAVRHQGTQAIETGADAPLTNAYRCELEAWPADRAWRPPRRTPVPRVPGLIHAVIDGPTAAPYADPDDDGCYRVRPLFDADGTASMAVRLATPYAGKDHGLHLPLHAGTEVLVAHIDGDPDRPVIAAAVPNPATPSQVVAGNRSQCVLRTAGGNRLVLEDALGREVWRVDAVRDRRATVGGDDEASVRGNRTSIIAGSDTVAVQGDATATVGRASSETVTGAKALTVGGVMQVSVGGALNHTVGGAVAEQVGAAKAEVVAGKRLLAVGKDFEVTVAGDQQETTAGKRQVRAKRIRLAAAEELLLTCGKATLLMKRNGDIVLSGAAITVKGSGKVVVKGSKVAGN